MFSIFNRINKSTFSLNIHIFSYQVLEGLTGNFALRFEY